MASVNRWVLTGFIHIFWLGFVLDLFSQQTPQTSPALTKFLLYTPPSYQPATPAPLLVSLHGAVGIGDDLNLLLNNPDQSPAWLINNNRWPSTRPFIVVTPQLKRDLSIPSANDQTWSPELVDEVIEYVKTLRNIDANRIYLTGLSLGAAGSWDYSIAYPNKLAALVPISGRTDTTKACLVPDIPIWAFHGEIDDQVNTKFSTGMINGINSCGPRNFRPQLNLLHALTHAGHTAWSQVWNYTMGYTVFDWMLNFSRENNSNKPPYVNAGIDRRILVRSGTLHISGYYFDSDGTIASVLWTKISGPAITMEDINSPMLKLSNLQSGNYTFQLQVIDNNGVVVVDQVILELVSTVGNQAIVNNIELIDVTNDRILGNLFDGQVINKSTLALRQINLRALSSSNTTGMRFRINSDRNSRTLTSGGPNFLMIPTTQPAKWTIPVGHYNICATPNAVGIGVDSGMQGISQCFKISVYDQPIKYFYAKSNSDLSDLNSWGLNTNGTGDPPTSFTGNFQEFYVQTSATVGAPLTVGGVESIFWVKTGGTVVLNNQFDGVINTESNSTVIVNTPHPVIFGVVDPNSTIIFDQAATVIPSGKYGHVEVRGAGSVKSLSAGNTVVAGNFTIGAGVSLQGAVENNSIVSVAGNVLVAGITSFLPTRPFELSFTSGATQQLIAEPPIIQFKKVNLLSSTQVTVSGNTTIRLGDATGGGLAIENSGRLNLASANLEILDGGTINTQNQTGTIGFNGGNLSISSSAAGNSNIYTVTGSDVVSTMLVNNSSGAGQVIIRNDLFITDVLTCQNGTLVSNGNITLLSTADKTASLAPVGTTAVITGDLNIQRFIENGRQYRYLSVPVRNFSVADLQTFIPVTGNFPETSTGNGMSSNPSMFYFDEPAGGWKPFPSLDNSENLVLGKGYAVFVRDDQNDTKIIATGEVHTGDFQFTLTPDPDETIEDNGWNLIGNPYASAIQWGDNGWSRSGVNNTIYVRDNTVNGGMFRMWDGQLGDVEFSGKIAQGQSFWVRTVNESPELIQLIVQEAAKTITQASLFRTSEMPDFESLIISMHQADQYDRCYVKFVKSASDKFDNYRDAIKRNGESFNIALQTSDLVKVALKNSVLDFCEKEYPLMLIQALPGSYSLSTEGSVITRGNYQVFLIDSYLDSVHHVSVSPYAFELTEDENSSDPARFKIRITLNSEMPTITAAGSKLISNYLEGNQWYKEGMPIIGATDREFEPTESGLYTLGVTYAGCTRQSEPITFVVTGLENLTPLNQLRVYPNPTTGRVYIETVRSQHSTESERIEYSVYSVMGRLIQQGTIENSMVDDGRHAIDMPYPSGVYFLILRSNKNTRMLKLILN